MLFALDNIDKLKDVQNLGIQWKADQVIPNYKVKQRDEVETDFGLRYLDEKTDLNQYTNISYYEDDNRWTNRNLLDFYDRPLVIYK